MSRIIEFIDKIVEFPLRWTADIDTTAAAIENLTRDPGTVYQEGTANRAEYFNSIQENGVYSVGSTIDIAGSTTTYTITDFITEGAFTIYEGFKLSMKSSGTNVGITKIDLLGTIYDIKVAIGGSYIDTINDDIITNDIAILEYRNGVFILLGGKFLNKGTGLSPDYNTAKKIEDKLEEKYNKSDWSKTETVTTGNQEMPNGIIMKWGNIINPGGTGFGKGTVTFDIPFPNNLLSVQLTNIGTSLEIYGSKVDNNSLSTDGFECWVEGVESAYRYLAIGN